MASTVHPPLRTSTKDGMQDSLTPHPADSHDTIELVTLKEELLKDESDDLCRKIEDMCHVVRLNLSQLNFMLRLRRQHHCIVAMTCLFENNIRSITVRRT